jgi:hypothetical protein
VINTPPPIPGHSKTFAGSRTRQAPVPSMTELTQRSHEAGTLYVMLGTRRRLFWTDKFGHNYFEIFEFLKHLINSQILHLEVIVFSIYGIETVIYVLYANTIVSYKFNRPNEETHISRNIGVVGRLKNFASSYLTIAFIFYLLSHAICSMYITGPHFFV